MGYYLLSFLMVISLSGALYAADTGGKIGMKPGKSEKASSAPEGKPQSVQINGEEQKKRVQLPDTFAKLRENIEAAFSLTKFAPDRKSVV